MFVRVRAFGLQRAAGTVGRITSRRQPGVPRPAFGTMHDYARQRREGRRWSAGLLPVIGWPASACERPRVEASVGAHHGVDPELRRAGGCRGAQPLR